jgi:hypothetical protein
MLKTMHASQINLTMEEGVKQPHYQEKRIIYIAAHIVLRNQP